MHWGISLLPRTTPTPLQEECLLFTATIQTHAKSSWAQSDPESHREGDSGNVAPTVARLAWHYQRTQLALPMTRLLRPHLYGAC